MGNGAVSHDYTESEQLDEAINGNVQKKPASSKDVPKSLEGDFNAVGSTPQMSEASSMSKEQPVRSEAKESKDSRSVTSKTKKKVEIEEEVSEVSSSDDMEPVDVLLQFIPFYGQGDPANDSIVRSALSSLSIEDIDAKDEYGNTLLLLACQYRCEDLARIMINKGANPNAVNTAGASCLHFACYQDSSSLPIAKVLLQNGANPDVAESNYGCTPLHYCAGAGDLEFCKLILQYGAQINAYDYYNYTCVDYAREAGFQDCASFLQKRLDKTAVKFNQSTKAGGLKSTQSFRNNETSYEDMSYWESHVDPDSGGKYYIHTKSGECLWEAELKERINAINKQQNFREGSNSSSNNLLSMKFSSPLAAEKPKISEAALISQATEARLIAFLSKHDPARLVDIASLIEKYKGKEQELLNDLCKQYKVQEDPEFKAFQDKLNELRSVVKQAHVAVTDVSMIDPILLHDITQETRKKLEAQLQDEKTDIKRKYEQMMDEDKNSYRSIISEKEGLIAKLQTEMDTIMRSKEQIEKELSAFKTKLDTIHKSDNSTQSQLQQELSALADENSTLKQEIHNLKQETYVRQEKVSTLEETLAKVTAGKEEMIAREHALSADRMEQQRQREQQYHSELQTLEAKYKNSELKLKSDLNQMKNENIRIEKTLRDEIDALKRAKDGEIDGLRRELADRKSQFAQELSSKQMEVEDCRKAAEAASKRADESEDFVRAVQNEIAEAKVVQKYNAQLHKDLLREQVARKKLHNDMEDLKGKIRVYVRVRPMSNSERDRGCTEAVLKDGKMSVLVKGVGGPDAKKFYDFDQVFGGPAAEGNSQVDVFKDTKHLMMSVVDGYNICIFAYGQTGAGKSYTMIGAADIGSCMSENGDFDEHAGITPRAVSELFRLLNERTAQVEYELEVTMFQLYRDGLEDLLKDKKKKKKDEDDAKEPPLKIVLAEHSPTGLVHVDGAEAVPAASPGDVMRIFAKGSSRRTTASTQMNAESSRSHLICCLVVKLTNRRSGAKTTGKLTLVDLAGSERVDKSGASGDQLKEAQSINKSLSALGDVISALTTSQQHIPYRNHPLTMLMSDSIGGNAKTLMFVNTSPADYNASESNSSLAFASRCKDVTNAVAAAPGVQAAQINALKKELAKLKKPGGGPPAGGPGGGALNRPDTAAGGRGRGGP